MTSFNSINNSVSLHSVSMLAPWKESYDKPSVHCMLSFQTRPTLCNPMDCSPPGSIVHGLTQARILQWISMPSSRGSSQTRDQTSISSVSCFVKQVLFFLREGNGNPLQHSCLEDPMDKGAWQAKVHGTARVRHDLALSFLSWLLAPLGKPHDKLRQHIKKRCFWFKMAE